MWALFPASSQAKADRNKCWMNTEQKEVWGKRWGRVANRGVKIQRHITGQVASFSASCMHIFEANIQLTPGFTLKEGASFLHGWWIECLPSQVGNGSDRSMFSMLGWVIRPLTSHLLTKPFAFKEKNSLANYPCQVDRGNDTDLHCLFRWNGGLLREKRKKEKVLNPCGVSEVGRHRE